MASQIDNRSMASPLPKHCLLASDFDALPIPASAVA
jgi:hypothetical protein